MNFSLKTTRTHRHLSPRLIVLFSFLGLFLAVGSHAWTADFTSAAPPKAGSKAPAQKLVGTVVSSNPIYSLAVVEELRNRRQRIFHESERTGHMIIRKILPGQLIIEIGGSKRTVRIGHYLASGTGVPSANEMSRSVSSIKSRPGSRYRYRVIDRERVIASLSNIQEVIDSVNISAGRPSLQDKGIRIAGFGPESIFSEMGLRSGDLLLAINDHEIAGPEEAASLLNTFREGGDNDLTVRRRARTYHINLMIQ